MRGSFERKLAEACGAPAALERIIDIGNRPDSANLELLTTGKRAELGHQATWESGGHLFEVNVRHEDSNLAGTLFGGNILGWMHHAAQSLLVSRIPNITPRDIASHQGTTKFSLPVFPGDSVRFFPHIGNGSRGGIHLNVRIDMLRMHDGVVDLAATSHWDLSMPMVRQIAPDAGILKSLALSYGATPLGIERAAHSGTGSLLAWLDLAVTQAAFNFADTSPRSDGELRPNPRNFATRTFEFELYPFPGSIAADDLRVTVTPDRKRSYDYHVQWSLLAGGMPISNGNARIIDVAKRKESTAVQHG